MLLGPIPGKSKERPLVLLSSKLPDLPVPEHHTDAKWVHVRRGAYTALVSSEEYHATARRADQLPGRSYSYQGILTCNILVFNKM